MNVAMEPSRRGEVFRALAAPRPAHRRRRQPRLARRADAPVAPPLGAECARLPGTRRPLAQQCHRRRIRLGGGGRGGGDSGLSRPCSAAGRSRRQDRRSALSAIARQGVATCTLAAAPGRAAPRPQAVQCRAMMGHMALTGRSAAVCGAFRGVSGGPLNSRGSHQTGFPRRDRFGRLVGRKGQPMTGRTTSRSTIRSTHRTTHRTTGG